MLHAVPFIHRRSIKFGETDAAAIVYTPRFSDFCMEAAEVWFRDYLDIDWYQINTTLGMGTPVVSMQLEFKNPLRSGDVLAIEIMLERVGVHSLTLLFNGTRESSDLTAQEISFTAKFVFCFVQNGAIPIPEKQRAMLDDYRVMSDKSSQ